MSRNSVILKPFENRNRRWRVLLLTSLTVIVSGLLHGFFGGDPFLGLIYFVLFLPGVLIALIQMYAPLSFERNQESYYIRPSFWASFSYAIFTGGIFIASLLCYLHYPSGSSFALLTSGFSCAAFVFCVLIALNGEPLISIDQRGFYDRSLRIGIIPWSEIVGASIDTTSGVPFIDLNLKDPERLLGRRTLDDRVLSCVDQIIGFHLVRIGMVGLEAEYADEVLDFILSHCGSVGSEREAFETLLSLSRTSQYN